MHVGYFQLCSWPECLAIDIVTVSLFYYTYSNSLGSMLRKVWSGNNIISKRGPQILSLGTEYAKNILYSETDRSRYSRSAKEPSDHYYRN